MCADDYARLTAQNEGCLQTAVRAALDAGIVPAADKRTLRFGVCDIEKLTELGPKVQAKVLREIFRAARVDAQCTFIANELQTIGADLASRWRAQSRPR